MKKVYLIISFIFCFTSIYSQLAEDSKESYYKQLKEVFDYYDDDEFYKAISKLDELVVDYPEEPKSYFYRGMVHLEMNNYYDGRNDLIRAVDLGWTRKKEFINFLTSKKFIVDEFVKYSKFDYSLSDTNGFKITHNLCDSLQGGLRPERTCYDVYYYDLTVKVLPKTKSIDGLNKIYFKVLNDTKRIQLDLSDKLEIEFIKMNGNDLVFERICNAVFVDFNEELVANQNYELTVKYSGSPRIAPDPPWNGGFVWKNKRFKKWVGVACEHLGASSWWPCKDHLSEKPDSMTINVQVPSKYKGISNGNLISTKEIEGKYTNYEWFVSYPINSYNVTFYMGDFVNFSEEYTNRKGKYNIDYYVLPFHLETARKYYSQTKDIVKVYENLFGEYPYKDDGIAMVEAPYEGMEHQSAIAIGDSYQSDGAYFYEDTDYSYIVVHELAHEWWGNTVTMGDMADAWISEGFATYTELLFMEQTYGYKKYIRAAAEQMLYILNIWPMVGAPDVNDNSFFGGDIYNKGAAMLNNLRCDINNDTIFFGMIKSFYQNNMFKTLKTIDFINHVNNYTGKDYTEFFNKFLYDIEPPILEYEFVLKDNILRMRYKWDNVGEGFTMPFSITINEKFNYRLEGTTEYTVVSFSNVEKFYIPTEKYYNSDNISKNAFTYFWTHWTH